jgi:hypothetical protein
VGDVSSSDISWVANGFSVLTRGFPASSSGFRKSPCKLSARPVIFETLRLCRRRQTKKRSTRLRNTNTTEMAIPALAPELSLVLPFGGSPLVAFEVGRRYDVVWLNDGVLIV